MERNQQEKKAEEANHNTSMYISRRFLLLRAVAGLTLSLMAREEMRRSDAKTPREDTRRRAAGQFFYYIATTSHHTKNLLSSYLPSYFYVGVGNIKPVNTING
jgi:hypothetical protein